MELDLQEETPEPKTTLFDRFYSAYPRKVGKGAALKAWEKLKPDESLCQKMILAIDAQKRSRRRQEDMNLKLPEKFRRFIPDWPHCSTWLNAQRWDDEIPSTEEVQKQTEVEHCTCGKVSFIKTNGESLCCWCYSRKYAATGPTGLDVLRAEYGRLKTTGTLDAARQSALIKIRNLASNKRNIPKAGDPDA